MGPVLIIIANYVVSIEGRFYISSTFTYIGFCIIVSVLLWFDKECMKNTLPDAKVKQVKTHTMREV